MKTTVKKFLQSLLFVPAFALALGVVAPVGPTFAADCPTDGTVGDDPLAGGVQCAKGDKTGDSLFGENSIFKSITNILLFIVGAISVIMLIIGGIRYVVSGGDQNAVQGAKNTILYAIVGIVVAFLAFAAVNFVLTSLQPSAEN